jgi:hypothetical protein
MDAFYAPLDKADGTAGFHPTGATQGPWSARMQHGGPPSALILREMERLAPAADGHVAKLAVDFLAPVPVAPLTVHTTVLKPGRRAQLLTAEVVAEGRTVLTAHGWWRRRVDALVPEVADAASAPFPDPDSVPIAVADEELSRYLDHGWMRAMEFRYLAGGPTRSGPCRVWVRPRLPLVEGEPTSPTQNAVLVADGSSGVSSALDFRTHLFSNLDLNLSFLRPPEGLWVGVDAASTIDSAGGGTTVARLADRHGVYGYSQQSLFVEPHGRGPA